MIQASLKFVVNPDKVSFASVDVTHVHEVCALCSDIMHEMWIPIDHTDYIKNIQHDLLRQFIFPSFTKEGIRIIRECLDIVVLIRNVND